MKPVVFAGPSVSGISIPNCGQFDIAPPAQCGDILNAVDSGYKVIGLIDGIFEAGPAVWHKEILYALSCGCTLLGAASMGALRAAECRSLGMIGVGQVFADYSTGRRTADADVALLHGPAELRYIPLTVAQVDVDDILDRLHEEKMIDAGQQAAIRLASQAMFYKERTWETLLERCSIPPALRSRVLPWINISAPHRKTRDALEMLELLPQMNARKRKYKPFVPTQFFSQLLARKRRRHG